MPVPSSSTADVWTDLWEPVVVMERLLTFAHRCHIQIVHPTYEVQTETGWRPRGGHSYLFQDGRARGVSWYIYHEALEQFLDRSFPKMMDPGFRESTALMLSLAFYDQIFSDRITELQYLKTWLALEILISRGVKNTTVLPTTRFNPVRDRINAALSSARDAGLLSEDEEGLFMRKVGNLNELNLARKGEAFFTRVFASYNAQDVTLEEFSRFVSIRNHISHTGTMRANYDNYAQVLHHEFVRLKALLERVVLALLGGTPEPHRV